jgi:D-amino peptidase
MTRFVALLILGMLAGCAVETETVSSEDERLLSDPASNDDGVLRALVYHDMEGLSGQDDPRTFSYRETESYPRGRELLTADVNAVIDGLFSGGADEVHVVDAHGSGSPEPDLLLDQLDSRATMTFRDERYRPYVDLVEEGVYDAVAAVGMHAKTGSGGFASHTYTLGMDIIMNGMSITETELIGYSWGRVSVPVIFASGDDRLARDLETMPWIEFVTVKRATSASSAELRPLDEVHAEMREAAKRAVENLEGARSMQLVTPIRAALRVVPPATLEMLDGIPGIEYEAETVSFEAQDFGEAYDGVTAFIGVATTGYIDVLFEALATREDGTAIRNGFVAALFERWMDVESGRWSPPETPEPAEDRRYHGVN